MITLKELLAHETADHRRCCCRVGPGQPQVLDNTLTLNLATPSGMSQARANVP
jgi:hypothetical protein